MNKKVYSVILFFLINISIFANSINILVVHTYALDFPWTKSFQKGLLQAQEAHPDIIYFTEYIDYSRVGNSLSEVEFADYIKKKYSDIIFQAVIADSDPAAKIFYSVPDLCNSIPQIIYSPRSYNSTNYQLNISPQIEAAIVETTKLATEQNPLSKKVLIIDGENPATKVTIEIIKLQLEENGVEIEVYNNFSLTELEDRVKKCTPNTIIIYTLVSRDKTGKKFVPADVLEKLSEISNAPIYTFWGSLANTGCVGGSMIDAEVISKEGVLQALNFIEHHKFQNTYKTNQTYINWKAIKRFKIKYKSIPPDAIILNKPIPFFILHYKESITFIALFFITTTIIIFIQFKRYYSINVKMKEQTTQLQTMFLEKSYLYNEMNNRIKNNLTILSSIIEMQILDTKNIDIKLQLKNIIERLRTLSIVQEEYTREYPTHKSEMHSTLKYLINRIFIIHVPKEIDFQINFQANNLFLENKDVIALCLIIHELLTNSLKYAFNDQENRFIKLNIQNDKDSMIELTFSDNGAGFPPNFNATKDSKIGYKIVMSLVKQLNGTFLAFNSSGAVCLMKFNI